MKFEVVICRQESFTIEADSEDDAYDIALDNVGLEDFDNRKDKRIIDYGPEETTEIIVNEVD